MVEETKIPIKGTRALIFAHLLRKDSNAIELEGLLGINESAVRRHLDVFEKDGFVTHYFKKLTVGRPKKIYRITPYGKKLLPKRIDLLFSILSRKIVDTYGAQALKKLMDQAADALAEYFLLKGTSHATGDAEQRLRRMVKVFNEFGFLASFSKDKGEFLVTYRNCAFSDAIPALGMQLCEMHRAAVVRTIGGEIKWEKCIARGDDICTQRVVLTMTSVKDRKESPRM